MEQVGYVREEKLANTFVIMFLIARFGLAARLSFFSSRVSSLAFRLLKREARTPRLRKKGSVKMERNQ